MLYNLKLCSTTEISMKKIECEGVGDNDGFFEMDAKGVVTDNSDLLCADKTEISAEQKALNNSVDLNMVY